VIWVVWGVISGLGQVGGESVLEARIASKGDEVGRGGRRV
jgi:hypothetical protein